MMWATKRRSKRDLVNSEAISFGSFAFAFGMMEGLSLDAHDDFLFADEEGEHNVENFMLCSFVHHACNPLLQGFLHHD